MRAISLYIESPSYMHMEIVNNGQRSGSTATLEYASFWLSFLHTKCWHNGYIFYKAFCRQFLAHLSRRLNVELIVYWLSRCLCVWMCVCLAVCL